MPAPAKLSDSAEALETIEAAWEAAEVKAASEQEEMEEGSVAHESCPGPTDIDPTTRKHSSARWTCPAAGLIQAGRISCVGRKSKKKGLNTGATKDQEVFQTIVGKLTKRRTS